MLPKLAALLKKFKGKELQLLQKVRTKYGGARHEDEYAKNGEEITTTTCDGCAGDCSERSWFVEETGEDYCEVCHSEKGKGQILQLNGVTAENQDVDGGEEGTSKHEEGTGEEAGGGAAGEKEAGADEAEEGKEKGEEGGEGNGGEQGGAKTANGANEASRKWEPPNRSLKAWRSRSKA
jgi:hypothetical protein